MNHGNVLDIDEGQPGQATSFDEFKALAKKAYEDGYDSIRVRSTYDDQGFRFNGDETPQNMEYPTAEHDIRTDILIVFDHSGNPGANRIKAADPVTFMDDTGGALPIPLEMRADQSIPDVRYSVAMGNRVKEEARAMLAKYAEYRPDGRIDETRSADAIGAFRQESGAQGLVGEDAAARGANGVERPSSENYLRKEFAVVHNDLGSAGRAANEIKKLLKERNVDRSVARRVAVAAYELEINICIHSHGGILTFILADDTITIKAKDRGPGIPDIEWACRDGTSTANDWIRSLGFGAGMGLSNSKRVADEFDIQSEVGRFTKVTCLFRIKH